MSSDARSARWAWLAVAGLSVFIAAFAIRCGSRRLERQHEWWRRDVDGVGKGRARSTSSPGPATSRTARPIRRSTGSATSKPTGCEVNVKIGNSSDEMVQLMQTGEYDGVSASGDATQRLIAGGEVAPINTDLIPNYADVFDDLKLQPWNSVDGVPYGCRTAVAPTSSCSTPSCHAGPDSWSEVFEDSTAAPRGRLGYDSPIYIADAALYLMATQPDLGITNPYALDQDQFDAAVALLEAAERLVGQYWSRTPTSRPARGRQRPDGHDLAGHRQPRSGQRRQIDAVKPAEGATGWSDTWMISLAGQEPELHVHVDGSHRRPRPTPRSPSTSARRRATRRPATHGRSGICDLFTRADGSSTWPRVYY